MNRNQAAAVYVTRILTEDEEWPVINIRPAEDAFGGVERDIPVALAHRYEAARREWDAVQEELARVFDWRVNP